MENENKAPKDNWKLNKIEIKFENGRSWREGDEQHDRYVGKIEFANEASESFNLNIPTEMTERYLKLMADEIVRTAETLGAKIANSIIKLNEN